MSRDNLLLAGIALLSVIAGALAFVLTSSQPVVISAERDDQPQRPLLYHELIFSDLDGKQHTLDEWDKPLQVINLWAPWCAPCRREIPALIKLQDRYAEQVQFIGIAYDQRQNVTEFSAQYPFNYPLLLTQQSFSDVNGFFGNKSGGLPFTVILDRQRKLVFRHAGEVTEHQLGQKIDSLL